MIRDMKFFVLESTLVTVQPRFCYVMMVMVILISASRVQFVWGCSIIGLKIKPRN